MHGRADQSTKAGDRLVNQEVEAKMALGDVKGLVQRLRELGARRGRRVIEVDMFFDTPQSTLRASDQGLRLRVERSVGSRRRRCILTHKGPRAQGPVKTRTETEVQVDDPAAAAELLTHLGYQPIFTFEKERQYWELDGCSVAIDRLPYLGYFVEIEGPDSEVVLAVRQRLGLENEPILQATYLAMLTAYLAEHHIYREQVRLEEDGA